jgi:riboflavin kinase/FMN adenylyltransferase
MILDYNDNYDKKIVLCLGFFDSVHIGHRKIFDEALIKSKLYGAELSVFTFDNNPFEPLNKEDKLIYDFDSRVKIFNSLGIQNIIKCEFNKDFIKIDSEDFLDHLIKHFNIVCIVCGNDYSYGYKGEGNVDTLKKYLKDYGIEVLSIDLLKDMGQKVSSSNIRKYLINGEINLANNLLGEPYHIESIVQKGRGVGTIIGFPTVNLEIPKDRILVKKGVYITKTIIDEKCYYSISNVGTHPTFNDEHNNIETFIIDCKENLYGKMIKIEFYAFIRDIIKFNNADELKYQLEKDLKSAKNFFKEQN